MSAIACSFEKLFLGNFSKGGSDSLGRGKLSQAESSGARLLFRDSPRAPTTAYVRLDLLFRSETLPMLRKFLEMSPDLKSLVDQRGLQIRAIVDNNRIFADLLWKLSKREDPCNRSSLDEDLDSGVLVLIAPDYLEVEIREKFPILADRTGASLAEMEHMWAI